jgi:parallel beta-helix repeat protein
LYLEGANRVAMIPVKVFAHVIGWTDMLTENFEGTFPGDGWQVSDSDGVENGEYFWAKRDCRPHAGAYSAWAVGGGRDGNRLACGADYPNRAFSYMIYGPLNLCKATSAELVFQYWLNTESGDRFSWLVSTDGSNFHGYWESGASNGWQEKRLNLADAPFLGDVTGAPSVWIAFTYASDDNDTRAEGVYLDDIVLSAFLIATRSPKTITVCPSGPPTCDYAAIRDALQVAICGDTISVAPGTYKESITMVSGVKIEGAGPGRSIIDSNGVGRVVKATEARITNEAILEGFTITGGVAPTTFNCGGGVLVQNGASPTFTRNEITGNSALNGAGICIMYSASPSITENIISNNNTVGGPGGGIYVFNSRPTLADNTIVQNTGTYGGGIHARVESYPVIDRNTIVSNTASSGGGGVWMGGYQSYATGGILSGNTIRANTAHYSGGGVCVEANAAVKLRTNIISNNTTDWHGGGIYLTGSSSISSTLDIIAHNTAAKDGGGLTVDGGSLATMSGVTVHDNRANGYGGGIYTSYWWGVGDLHISNSMVKGNSAGSNGGGICVSDQSSATIQGTTIFSNSAQAGGGIYLNGTASLIGNTISDNRASGPYSSHNGGGIYAYADASFDIRRNSILRNTAMRSGGGIYVGKVVSSTLEDNIIQGNQAQHEYGGGGGIHVAQTEQLEISGNVILDNEGAAGGGVHLDNSSGTLHNNIIARNRSSVRGSGVYIHSSAVCQPPCPDTPIVSNNTVVSNTGTGEGISVYIYAAERAIPSIVNNTIVSNTYGVRGGGHLSHNNAWHNSAADYDGVSPGPGSISADPLFVSGPHGQYYLSQAAAGQAVDSPCVDTGNDTAANLELDDRTTRTDAVPDSGTVDMGYHYQPTGPVWYSYCPLALRDY